MTIELPGDYHILQTWFNFIRAMRSKTCTAGYTVVVMRAIIDEHGVPVAWLEPDVNKISPVSANEILRAMFDGVEPLANEPKSLRRTKGLPAEP